MLQPIHNKVSFKPCFEIGLSLELACMKFCFYLILFLSFSQCISISPYQFFLKIKFTWSTIVSTSDLRGVMTPRKRFVKLGFSE